MINVILYEITQKDGYNLKNLVSDLYNNFGDDTQGVIIHEYDEEFLKATYWKKMLKKEYRYILEKREFEEIEQEIIDAVDFEIEMEDQKLLIFGNKQMAQRIITLLGIISGNSYIISEFLFDIEKIANLVCGITDIDVLKMKLKDISLEKGVLVNCSINLVIQDNTKYLVSKYIKNIVTLSFRISKIPVNITVHRSGKFSISKFDEEDKDEMIKSLIEIIC